MRRVKSMDNFEIKIVCGLILFGILSFYPFLLGLTLWSSALVYVRLYNERNKEVSRKYLLVIS